MNTIKTFAAVAATTLALSATTTTAEEGSVRFYEHTHFSGVNRAFYVSPPTNVVKCYNIAKCFPEGASSANWDLRFEGKLAFYTKANCEGEVRAWPIDTKRPPANFGEDGLNDLIVSMAVFGRQENVEQCENLEAKAKRFLADDGTKNASTIIMPSI